MGFKKYVNDYRNEYIIKPNGKPGMLAVYKGKYFKFVADEGSLKKARITFGILSVFATALTIIPFFYKSVGADTLYVALPHVIALFPLLHLLMGVWSFWFRKPPLIREYNDKIKTRITVSSVASMLILGAVAIAETVNCVIAEFPVPDIVYFLLLSIACAATGVIFFSRAVLETEECDQQGEKK